MHIWGREEADVRGTGLCLVVLPLFFHFSPLLTNVIVRPFMSLDWMWRRSCLAKLERARLPKLDDKYEFCCGVLERGNLKSIAKLIGIRL